MKIKKHHKEETLYGCYGLENVTIPGNMNTTENASDGYTVTLIEWTGDELSG